MKHFRKSQWSSENSAWDRSIESSLSDCSSTLVLDCIFFLSFLPENLLQKNHPRLSSLSSNSSHHHQLRLRALIRQFFCGALSNLSLREDSEFHSLNSSGWFFHHTPPVFRPFPPPTKSKEKKSIFFSSRNCRHTIIVHLTLSHCLSHNHTNQNDTKIRKKIHEILELEQVWQKK